MCHRSSKLRDKPSSIVLARSSGVGIVVFSIRLRASAAYCPFD
jgi:hypothetical protein